MKSLDQQIIEFSRLELPQYLKIILQNQNLETEVKVRIIDSPAFIADVNVQTRMIDISVGWIHRVTILFELLHQMWTTRDDRSKLYAINSENAYDAHFFLSPENVRSQFGAIPDLAVLFVDDRPDGELEESLNNFCANFNKRHGGYEGEDNRDGLLNFSFSEELSKEAKGSVTRAFHFLLLHELAHITRGHERVSGDNEYSIVSEFKCDKFDSPFNSKACEIDADIQAAKQVVEYWVEPHDDGYLEAIAQVFTDIFILLSSFDMSKKSIGEYRGSFATHPAPDVRAFCISFMLSQIFEKQKKPYANLIKLGFESAVKHCARSFQQICIPQGAFLIIGNRYLSIDRQIGSEVFVVATMNDELNEISKFLSQIWILNSESWVSIEWSFLPFVMPLAEFKKKCQEHFFGQICNKQTKPTETSARETYIENLENIKKELDIESGDSLIIFGNTEMNSPYYEKFYDGKTYQNSSTIEQEMVEEHQRIMRLTFELILYFSDAKALNEMGQDEKN